MKWRQTPATPQPAPVLIVEMSTLTNTPVKYWRGRDSRSWTRHRDRAVVLPSRDVAELSIHEYCLEDTATPVVVSF